MHGELSPEDRATLGLYHVVSDASICTFVGCERPARYHLAVTIDCENVTACDDHLGYAMRELEPLAGHELRVECVMTPGPVVWFDDGCRLPDDTTVASVMASATAGD